MQGDADFKYKPILVFFRVSRHLTSRHDIDSPNKLKNIREVWETQQLLSLSHGHSLPLSFNCDFIFARMTF